MLKSYFRIALRNVVRSKTFTAINVLGLSIGMASCILIFLVIKNEWNYDRDQPNYKNIYRLAAEYKSESSTNYTPGVPYPALEAMRLEFPQLAIGALRISKESQVTVLNETNNKNDLKKFIEARGVFFGNAGFFKVFHYNWLEGDAPVLNAVNNVVLTKSTAKKYFGNWQNAAGSLIKLDNNAVLKVSGIIDDVTGNTDFPLNVVVSFETLKANASQYNYDNNWSNVTSQFQVFLSLPQSVGAVTINEQLKKFVAKYSPDDGYSKTRFFLQPLSDIHFDSRFGNFGGKVTSRATLYTLGFIGLLIIVMACINFINLSTAQAVNRSKEMGVRKVLGGNRLQLAIQVMNETALLVLLSVIAATGIAAGLLPYLARFISLGSEAVVFSRGNMLFIAGLSGVVILLSGLYPSLIMSGFTPVIALKNKINAARVAGISLRRALVVLQFAIAQMLIIGTIIAVSQMDYLHKADLGFNKEAILMLKGNADSAFLAHSKSFKDALLGLPGVQNASLLYDAPSSRHTSETNFSFNSTKSEPYGVSLKFGDADYVKTFGLQLLAGQSYQESDTSNAVIANETLMRKLGFKDPLEMIGKSIRLNGENKALPVTGVVKDFASNTLRSQTKPVVILAGRPNYTQVAIKLNAVNIAQTLQAVQQAWGSVYPDYVYSSSFLDEDIANFYQQEQKLSVLYKIFAALAIFISSLGLYGLVSFMAVQRTKEIGIRKVLGASVIHIVYLFSKEFTNLIIIAFAIAVPVGYLIMNNWLSNFAYRIHAGIGIFALTILVSILFAWITVGAKAIKAAVASPVKSLRTE